MFNISTGTVSHREVVLRRGETREDFLATDAGANAMLILENKGWSTYRLSPDEKVFFIVQFKNDVIEQVRIAIALNANDPNPWTVKSETARKSLHDQLLQEEIGPPPYRFSWGQIESVTDPRSGASQIIMTYA